MTTASSEQISSLQDWFDLLRNSVGRDILRQSVQRAGREHSLKPGMEWTEMELM